MPIVKGALDFPTIGDYALTSPEIGGISWAIGLVFPKVRLVWKCARLPSLSPGLDPHADEGLYDIPLSLTGYFDHSKSALADGIRRYRQLVHTTRFNRSFAEMQRQSIFGLALYFVLLTNASESECRALTGRPSAARRV